MAVDSTFHARGSVVGTGGFAPIASAWRESGSVLSESVASLMTVTAALIPWVLVAVPVFWVLRRVFRRLFRKRPASP